MNPRTKQSRLIALRRNQSGFSLSEVMVSLGIMAFSVVAVLGVFPMGMKQSLASVNETRSTHLAKAIFTTLESGPFNAVTCYGETLDLTFLDDSAPANGESQPQVTLYASFPPTGEANISSTATPSFDYQVSLRFRRVTGANPAASDTATPPPVIGSRVTMNISPHSGDSKIAFESTIGNY